MRVCDLNTGSGRLMRAAKTLREQWAEANSQWDDAASRQIDQAFVKPMGPEIQMTLSAIQRLAEVLEQAEKECDDREAVHF